jgi:hypothetical protein
VIPVAHVGGIPVEEALGSFTPAILLAFGAASATLRARLSRARSPAGTRREGTD